MASPPRRPPPRRLAIRERDEGAGQSMLYALIVVILVAFGAILWNIYGGAAAPRLEPEVSAYKSPGSPESEAVADDQAETAAVFEPPPTDGPVAARAAPEAPLAPQAAVPPPGARPELSAAPVFVSDGGYLAQLAAVRTEESAQIAWRRLASRAPALFASARLNVERADLGARGVYYRVRAGYFADRENVGRFCERIRAMGQDCIAVQR